MWKDRIALQLYSVRADLKQDFYGTLQKVKEMGYAAVEFAGLFGNDPVEVREMCEKLVLVPLSAHVPFLDLRDNLDKTMDCYAALGCKHIVVPYLLEEYRPGHDAFFGVIEALPGFGEAAAKRGMILQYHNHDFEFTKLNGKYALDLMFETVSPEKLQTQLDTCWVKVVGEDPTEYLRKYANRIPTVHLKDYAGVRSEYMYGSKALERSKDPNAFCEFEFRPLGKGLQDFPAIIQAALDSGAQWFIVEQDRPSMGYSAMECATISAKYLLNEVDI